MLRLFHASTHLDAADLHERLYREEGVNATRAALYENLHLFEALYLITRRHENGRTLFELHFKLAHLHLRCIRCGHIIEIGDRNFFESLRQQCHENGFEAHRIDMNLYGLCRVCRNDNESREAPGVPR